MKHKAPQNLLFAGFILALSMAISHAIVLPTYDQRSAAEVFASQTVAPPFVFPPWDEGCIACNGGNCLGETNRNVAVWKIGPRAVVWSRHVGFQARPNTTEIIDVRNGTAHRIASVHPLGSDIVLGITATPFESWGAVWDDYRVTTSKFTNWFYFTNSAVSPPQVSGFPFPNERVDPTSISNLAAVVVCGGPGAVLRISQACITGPDLTFTKTWSMVTNIQLTVPKKELWLQSIRNNENLEISSSAVQAQITLAADNAPMNPGFITGDSSGALFVRDERNDWRLLGLLHSGAQCRGGTAVVPVVSRALYLLPEYWESINVPQGVGAFSTLTNTYFARAPKWREWSATLPTPTPSPFPLPIPLPPSGGVPTPAENVTVLIRTNVISVMRPGELDAIEQVVEWLKRALPAYQSILHAVQSNKVTLR